MLKILVVGQTPPPFGGQAMMIGQMLKGNYRDIRLYHVRMAFSKEMDEIGKFNFSKIFHLFSIIARIFYFRFRYNTKVLYYPPGGHDRNPMYRDLIILTSTRWLFSKTIFHFHAAGVSAFQGNLPSVIDFFYRISYLRPDMSIRPATYTVPDDGRELLAKNNSVVYNGMVDHYDPAYKVKAENSKLRILFVGMIRKEKGVECLINAASVLKKKGIDFIFQIVGKFESVKYEEYLKDNIKSSGLSENILFLGVKEGRDKYELYANADIFCLPSHFETFGLVCVEAMQFKLPIVATRIGALTEIISENESGCLFPVDDAIEMAAKIEILAADPEKRVKMGEKGRDIFLAKFTVEKFYNNIEKAFLQA